MLIMGLPGQLLIIVKTLKIADFRGNLFVILLLDISEKAEILVWVDFKIFLITSKGPISNKQKRTPLTY